MTFAHLVRRASKLAIDNSPTILTTIGVVGTVTTAYLAGKASFEAADIIALKEEDDRLRGVPIDDNRERLKDRVRLVWKLYIPAATTGLAAITCIIGANRVGARRAAGLAAAYTITEKTFEEYKAKVVEKIGERKEEQIHDEIAQDRILNSRFEDDLDLRGLRTGEICYDMFGGQYFRSSVEELNSTVNSINNTINHDGYASLADFYRILDIDVPAFSENVGWNSDHLIEIRISATVMHEAKACLVVSFKNDPLPDYGRFH